MTMLYTSKHFTAESRLRFPTKIAEHRLLFIAQPRVISQPSFLETS